MSAHGPMPRSSLAAIGLTVPTVAVAAWALDKQLVLGLNVQEMVLLLLTFILSMLTFGLAPGAPTSCSGWYTWWCLPCSCSWCSCRNFLE